MADEPGPWIRGTYVRSGGERPCHEAFGFYGPRYFGGAQEAEPGFWGILFLRPHRFALS